MKKAFCLVCTLMFVLSGFWKTAPAEGLPRNYAEAMLLTTVSEDRGEFGAVGYEVLGQKKKGRDWSLYLAAAVGRYGYMGGYCTQFSGWSGPCTLVFQKVDGTWFPKEILLVEDYSEIPEIMPKNMEKKFLQGRFSEKKIRQMLQDSIDRFRRSDRPMGSYAQAGGELPGIITIASNLLTAFDDPWPAGCTTVERVEDDQRMLYTKTWSPDEGVEEELETAFEDVPYPYSWGGTTGTETFVKTRQEDGKVLETITAHASLNDLKVVLQDAYGSITYTLPLIMTENHYPEYRQPAVTCQGSCQMDVEVFERYLAQLEGKRKSEWMTEAQVNVSDTERFTLQRDTCYHRLCHEILKDGQWETDWTNPQIIENHCEAMGMRFEPGESVQETGRFSRTVRDPVFLYAGDEHPDVWIELSRSRSGTWQVDTLDCRYYMEHAYLLEDCMLIQNSSLSSDSHALFVPQVINREASTFRARDIFEAHETLMNLLNWDFDLAIREQYVNAALMDNYADIGEAEVLYACLEMEKTIPVYVYPDSRAPRAAKGKAALSLKEPAAFLCREGDWLMVHYETGKGKHRTGWVNIHEDPILEQIAKVTMEPAFTQDVAKVRKKTMLVDDPINVSGTLCTLKKGTKVTVLARKAPLFYVEATVGEKMYRGYVESGSLDCR
ncbi:MAG: hypothetical protein IJL88_00980 [Clostridia bacterium]|nr:hypothetical protein [Clostridia bacterium]